MGPVRMLAKVHMDNAHHHALLNPFGDLFKGVDLCDTTFPMQKARDLVASGWDKGRVEWWNLRKRTRILNF